jgi:pimeloyl-ACP methyl ester carboxylesterase
MPDPELHTLTLKPSGLTAHYYRAGSGPTLLYLHHMMGLVGWEPALEALSESFEVIAAFHPGWGPAKDELTEVTTNLDLVLYYADLLDALDVERTHVAGIGVGAWIAAELAAIYPQRVERLVLVNPIGIWDPEAPGVDPFAQSPAAPTGVLFSQPDHRASLLMEGRDRLEAYVQEALDLRAAAKFMWPIADTGVEARLPRIKAPTLVVTSANDRVVLPALGPRWQRAIEGAELTELPDAGHLAELEAPEAFAALVRGWTLEGAVATPA